MGDTVLRILVARTPQDISISTFTSELVELQH